MASSTPKTQRLKSLKPIFVNAVCTFARTLWMCWQNHQEAMERDAKRVKVPAAVVKPSRQIKAEQLVNLLRRKMEAFLSGMSIGAAVALLIVWLLLLAAGLI